MVGVSLTRANSVPGMGEMGESLARVLCRVRRSGWMLTGSRDFCRGGGTGLAVRDTDKGRGGLSL